METTVSLAQFRRRYLLPTPPEQGSRTLLASGEPGQKVVHVPGGGCRRRGSPTRVTSLRTVHQTDQITLATLARPPERLLSVPLGGTGACHWSQSRVYKLELKKKRLIQWEEAVPTCLLSFLLQKCSVICLISNACLE